MLCWRGCGGGHRAPHEHASGLRLPQRPRGPKHAKVDEAGHPVTRRGRPALLERRAAQAGPWIASASPTMSEIRQQCGSGCRSTNAKPRRWRRTRLMSLIARTARRHRHGGRGRARPRSSRCRSHRSRSSSSNSSSIGQQEQPRRRHHAQMMRAQMSCEARKTLRLL